MWDLLIAKYPERPVGSEAIGRSCSSDTVCVMIDTNPGTRGDGEVVNRKGMG